MPVINEEITYELVKNEIHKASTGNHFSTEAYLYEYFDKHEKELTFSDKIFSLTCLSVGIMFKYFPYKEQEAIDIFIRLRKYVNKDNINYIFREIFNNRWCRLGNEFALELILYRDIICPIKINYTDEVIAYCHENNYYCSRYCVDINCIYCVVLRSHFCEDPRCSLHLKVCNSSFCRIHN